MQVFLRLLMQLHLRHYVYVMLAYLRNYMSLVMQVYVIICHSLCRCIYVIMSLVMQVYVIMSLVMQVYLCNYITRHAGVCT
jgi:hypothetical protein